MLQLAPDEMRSRSCPDHGFLQEIEMLLYPPLPASLKVIAF